MRGLLLLFPAIALGLTFGIRSVIFVAAVFATLNYLRQREWGAAFGTAGTLTLLSLLGVGSAIQVRLDTGDQRFCFWGFPVMTTPMQAESRQALLSLDDPEVPRRWVGCATDVGTNHAAAMVYCFYRDAAAWVDVDPQIARLILRDIARYLEATHALQGLPDCSSMLWLDTHQRFHVPEGWEQNPQVQAYLAAKGYQPGQPTGLEAQTSGAR